MDDEGGYEDGKAGTVKVTVVVLKDDTTMDG